LADLSERGFLTAKVFHALDPAKVYGVSWYNTKQRSRQRKKVVSRPEEEHIAVPITDAGLGIELVTAARAAIQDNTCATRSTHRDHWALLGLACCVCGAYLGTHSVKRRNGAYAHYYACTRRRNGRGDCQEMRYHAAARIEARSRAFTRSLLRRPEIIVEQTQAYIEGERQKTRN